MGQTALIVLGGGITAERKLNEHSRKRYEKALDIHKNYDIIICSTDKSYRKLNEFRDTSEAKIGKQFLVKRGVNPNKIYLEQQSRDTFSNAYFCRTTIIDPLDIKNITVLTSEFHITKAKIVFGLVFDKTTYTLSFIESENGAVDEKQLQSRKISERIVNDFYNHKLKMIYNITPGNLESIRTYMNEYNPSFTGYKDKHHQQLTDDLNEALKDKKNPLY
ncbi:MAG: YdcF family protein [Nanobdellota archaeon]